jgi:hypothetical protein
MTAFSPLANTGTTPGYVLQFTYNGIQYEILLSGWKSIGGGSTIYGSVEDAETLLSEICTSLASLHEDDPGFGPTLYKYTQAETTYYTAPAILDDSQGSAWWRNSSPPNADLGGGGVFIPSGDSTFGVKLSAAPSGDVTVTVTAVAASPPNGSFSASPASLTFTTSNWNTPQTVTVGLSDPGDQSLVGSVLMTASGYGSGSPGFSWSGS